MRGKKVFLFVHAGEDRLSLTVKLPESAAMALEQPFAEPTGYGLGKSGWVSARFGPEDPFPMGMVRDWVDESWRAVAPKRLAASHLRG